MRAKRVPKLSWSPCLFCDAEPPEVTDEDDADLFAEEADLTAEIEIVVPGGPKPAIVRYHYRQQAAGLHA
jgi:hypothetical protein